VWWVLYADDRIDRRSRVKIKRERYLMCVCACAWERGWTRKYIGWDGERKEKNVSPCPHTHQDVGRIIYRTPPSGGSKFGFSVLSPGHTQLYTYIHNMYTHTIYISSIVLLYSHSWRIRRGTGPCRGWLHYIIIIIYIRIGIRAQDCTPETFSVTAD